MPQRLCLSASGDPRAQPRVREMIATCVTTSHAGGGQGAPAITASTSSMLRGTSHMLSAPSAVTTTSSSMRTPPKSCGREQAGGGREVWLNTARGWMCGWGPGSGAADLMRCNPLQHKQRQGRCLQLTRRRLLGSQGSGGGCRRRCLPLLPAAACPPLPPAAHHELAHPLLHQKPPQLLIPKGRLQQGPREVAAWAGSGRRRGWRVDRRCWWGVWR